MAQPAARKWCARIVPFTGMVIPVLPTPCKLALWLRNPLQA